MSPRFPVSPSSIQRAYICGRGRSVSAALQVLLDGVRQLVRDPKVRADVLLWTEDQFHLELVASVGFPRELERDVQHLIEPEGKDGEQGLVRKALRTRASVLSTDTAHDPLWLSCTVPQALDDTRSEFVVYLGGPFHAVINFESTRVGTFTEELAGVIEQAAAEMLLVVHHELHHAGEGLLRESLDDLRASSDVAQVLNICLKAVMAVMGASHGGVFQPPLIAAEGPVRSLRLIENRGLDLLELGRPYPVSRFGTIKQALENTTTHDAYCCESRRNMKAARDLVAGVHMLANYSYVLRARGLPMAVVHVESDSLSALPERHRRACAAFLEAAAGHLAALHWAEANQQRQGLLKWIDTLWQSEHDEFRNISSGLSAVYAEATERGGSQADLDQLYGSADQLARRLLALVDQLWRICREPLPYAQDMLRQAYDRALELEVPESDRRSVTVEGEWDFQVLAQEQALEETLQALVGMTHGAHPEARSVAIRLRGSRELGRGFIEVTSKTDFVEGSELPALFGADQDDASRALLRGLLSLSGWKLVDSDADPDQGRVWLRFSFPITAVEVADHADRQ